MKRPTSGRVIRNYLNRGRLCVANCAKLRHLQTQSNQYRQPENGEMRGRCGHLDNICRDVSFGHEGMTDIRYICLVDLTASLQRSSLGTKRGLLRR